MSTSVLELDRVAKYFPIRKQTRGPQKNLLAVAPINLSLSAGDIVAVVGESGCGKSTLGRLISFVMEPSSGRVLIDGVDPTTLPEREAKRARRAIQLVHQDPYSALNPRKTVSTTLVDPMLAHHLATRAEAIRKAEELLELVGLHPASEFLPRYPYELSGGQRQRIVIARALTVDPKVIVADEAVSMVDVSLRQSILGTLSSLRERLGVAFVFITHDLALAQSFSKNHKTLVMYAGRVMEYGETSQVIHNPRHPYTQILRSAVLDPDPDNNLEMDLDKLEGGVPDLTGDLAGCPLYNRCSLAQDRCRSETPALKPVSATVAVACHFATADDDGHSAAVSSRD